mgnify:CR=1 FL=1
MKPRTVALTAAIIVGLALLGYLVATVCLPSEVIPFRQAIRGPDPAELYLYLTMRVIVGTVNAGLLIILLAVYVGVYMRTHAEFTIGLIIFTTILILYAIMSGPLTVILSGPFRIYGLGPFAAFPELFTTIAVAVLLYLSLK